MEYNAVQDDLASLSIVKDGAVDISVADFDVVGSDAAALSDVVVELGAVWLM